MEDMFTLKLNARTISEAFSIAEGTEGVLIYT
jgi:hypothetical protein